MTYMRQFEQLKNVFSINIWNAFNMTTFYSHFIGYICFHGYCLGGTWKSFCHQNNHNKVYSILELELYCTAINMGDNDLRKVSGYDE